MLDFTDDAVEGMMDCSPHLSSMEEAINIKDAKIENKYYASQLLHIGENDSPKIELFSKHISALNATESQEALQVSYLLNKLIKFNDMCDKNGLRYMVETLKFVCTDKNFEEEWKSFFSFVFSSENNVVKKAKILAGC